MPLFIRCLLLPVYIVVTLAVHCLEMSVQLANFFDCTDAELGEFKRLRSYIA